MAATLKLVETATTLTYTGAGPMAGFSFVIQKNAASVTVTQVTPAALANGQTWQTLKAELASRLV
jgi:hypothetical protein